MRPYRIVLADDHVMLRQGIKKIIEASKDMVVVGEAGDGLDLLDLLKKISPDMVILDISMPKLRGIEATREINMTYPEIKILILSMHKKKEYFYHVFSAGAKGYLLKEDMDSELLSAIETIRQGEIYLSPLLSRALAGDLIEIYNGDAKLHGEPLTAREREVLKLIAEGKSSKEITDLVKYAIRRGYTTVIT